LTTQNPTDSSLYRSNLHLAALYTNSQRMVELLLRHGANMDIACAYPDDYTDRPCPFVRMTAGAQLLMHAALALDHTAFSFQNPNPEKAVEICDNRLRTISVMLRYGFDINKHYYSNTHLLLHILADHTEGLGKSPVTMVRTVLFMLNNGVDLARVPIGPACVLLRGGVGRYPIHELLSAKKCINQDEVKKELMKLLRRMLELGVDLDARDSEGVTPLAYAFQLGDTEVIDLLFQYGADDKSLASDARYRRKNSVDRLL
jgi:ankyrin repeat protein